MGLQDAWLENLLPLQADSDGVLRIGETRVTLDTVIAAYESGNEFGEIVRKYPTLALRDVYAAVAYYLWHPTECQAYLEQRSQQAAAIREQIEAQFPGVGIKERLLARRAGKL